MKAFLKAELHGAVGVLICAYVLFFLGMLKGLFAPDSIYSDPFAAPLMVAGFTLIIGAPISIAYGAPVYWLLSRTRRPNLLIVLVIGAAPAVMFIRSGAYFAGHALAVGVGVALFTHAFSDPDRP